MINSLNFNTDFERDFWTLFENRPVRVQIRALRWFGAKPGVSCLVHAPDLATSLGPIDAKWLFDTRDEAIEAIKKELLERWRFHHVP